MNELTVVPQHWATEIPPCVSLLTDQMRMAQKYMIKQTQIRQLRLQNEGICQTHTEKKKQQHRTGTDPPRDRINTLPGKDGHLCLIVCFTSSSEHTISNRLNAGPLTQTGFPDGGRLFHSTGKTTRGWAGGGGGGVCFFFFFADGVVTVLMMPHPDEDGSPGPAANWCVPSPVAVHTLTGIIQD